MRGRNPNPLGDTLSGTQKRVFAVAGALLLVVIAGVSVWAMRGTGSYGRSANGCINVTTPSTTGGGLIHACGTDAQAMCRSAQSGQGTLARLTREQCRQAGLAPQASPVTSTP